MAGNTGAMIALVPSVETAQRLAVPGGLPADEMHLTLVYLGEAAGVALADRPALIQAAMQTAGDFGQLRCDGFSIDILNPDGDDPCVVLGCGGEALEQVRDVLISEISTQIPEQKKPWLAHVTLIYTDDFGMASTLVDRTGPVDFDRLRVSFADETVDFPLLSPEAVPLVMVEVGKVDAADEVEWLATLGPVTAAVNAATWSKLPIADRDTQFAFRAATDRLAAHADSIEQFSSWFFWRDESKPANNRNSYRMPFADVFDDGTVKLVPAAVFSAAAQLSGAHGALPVIPEPEKEKIRDAIDRIYAKFRDLWDDPRQIPPWQRPEQQSAADEPVKASAGMEEAMPIELVDDEAVTAAVGLAPLRPPVAWYENPQLKRPTRIRVTDDGRVFGHIAAWKSCHTGFTDQCLQPPRSRTGYSQFATGTTMTAEGILLKTGNLVSGGEHAPHSFTASEAAAFYAATSAGKASVAIGEDAHGIWVAGALSAGVGEEGAQDLRQHPMSGDWRNLRGVGLEMIAALAVNVPGFPIPEYALTADGSEPLCLVSAGVVDEDAAAEAEAETQKIMQRVADLELRGNELKARIDRRRQGKILNIQLPVRGA